MIKFGFLLAVGDCRGCSWTGTPQQGCLSFLQLNISRRQSQLQFKSENTQLGYHQRSCPPYDDPLFRTYGGHGIVKSALQVTTVQCSDTITAVFWSIPTNETINDHSTRSFQWRSKRISAVHVVHVIRHVLEQMFRNKPRSLLIIVCQIWYREYIDDEIDNYFVGLSVAAWSNRIQRFRTERCWFWKISQDFWNIGMYCASWQWYFKNGIREVQSQVELKVVGRNQLFVS